MVYYQQKLKSEQLMYRKSTGSFAERNGVAPVAFLPGFTVEFSGNVIRVCGHALTPRGVEWPRSGRLSSMIKALTGNDAELMKSVIAPAAADNSGSADVELEIVTCGNSEKAFFCFELDTGIVRIGDNAGTEIEFVGARDNDKSFLFRGRGIRDCRVTAGNWEISRRNDVFCCCSKKHIPCDEQCVDVWEFYAAQSRNWWGDLYDSLERFPSKDPESNRELAAEICQFGMFPENTFYFDGNFSLWCRAARKLKLPLILRGQLEKICKKGMVWNRHAKYLAGIDDGLWMPQRSDAEGDPLELSWNIALDCSYSCIAAVEMFDYSNELFDMNFLEHYAFSFMKGVMRVAELFIVPADFQLQIPCGVLPGVREMSASGWGVNPDRQLYYIHALNQRLIKASSLLGERPDPVWLDISARLPLPRGEWRLPVSVPWGKSSERICSIIG